MIYTQQFHKNIFIQIGINILTTFFCTSLNWIKTILYHQNQNIKFDSCGFNLWFQYSWYLIVLYLKDVQNYDNWVIFTDYIFYTLTSNYACLPIYLLCIVTDFCCVSNKWTWVRATAVHEILCIPFEIFKFFFWNLDIALKYYKMWSTAVKFVSLSLVRLNILLISRFTVYKIIFNQLD